MPHLRLLMLSLLLPLVTGCNNDIIVEVVHIKHDTNSRLDPQSRYGRSVTNGMISLEQLGIQLTQTLKYADELQAKVNRLPEARPKSIDISPVPGQNPQPPAAKVVEPWRAESDKVLKPLVLNLTRINCGVTDRMKAYEKLFSSKEAVGQAWLIEREIAKTRTFLQESRLTLVVLKEQYRNLYSTLKSVADQDGDLNALLEKLGGLMGDEGLLTDAKLAVDASRPVGFGGFSTIGVFEINPSDPEYSNIFNSAQYVPTDDIGISTRAITATFVTTLGDSSIMIVQESPGQVRLYQVSNDPRQAVQNIALLVSKAANAAAKFLGVP